MPSAFIEHVNLTVRQPERSAKLLIDLFDWKIRWMGPAQNGGRTIHAGDDRFYIALYTPPVGAREWADFAKGQPLNHVAIVVEDLDEIERRVLAAGLRPFSHGNYEPGRRFYFLDHDGIEYEIVSYEGRFKAAPNVMKEAAG